MSKAQGRPPSFAKTVSLLGHVPWLVPWNSHCQELRSTKTKMKLSFLTQAEQVIKVDKEKGSYSVKYVTYSWWDSSQCLLQLSSRHPINHITLVTFLLFISLWLTAVYPSECYFYVSKFSDVWNENNILCYLISMWKLNDSVYWEHCLAHSVYQLQLLPS